MDSLTLSPPCSLNNRLFTAIGVLLCLAPALSVFSGLGLAPLYCIIAAIAMGLFFYSRTTLLKPLPLEIAILFLLWALITTAWTISPSIALMMWLKLALLFVSAIVVISVLHQANVTWPPYLIEASVPIALLLILIDRLTHGSLSIFIHHLAPPGKKPYVYDITELDRSATVIAIFIWPALLSLIQRGKKQPALLLWLVTFAILVTLKSLSAVMGIAAGSICFILAITFKDKVFSLLIALTLLLIAIIPLVMLYQEPVKIMTAFPKLPESSEHRLYIWQFVSHKALLHPIRGWGLDSSRVMPIKPSEMLAKGKSPLPLHPHNSILQLWLELGIPGVLFFAAFTTAILTTIKRLDADFRYKTLCICSYAAYLVIGLTAFGIWQEWWMSAGFLAVFALQGLKPMSTHQSADRSSFRG